MIQRGAAVNIRMQESAAKPPRRAPIKEVGLLIAEEP